MTSDVQTILNQTWERYEIPESTISAEFPGEPIGDVETDDTGVETITLSFEQDSEGSEFRIDLAITEGQVLEVDSSEAFAEQLRQELKDEEELELISVSPRSYDDFPGVIQRMRLRETGETLLQWIIATPDDTVFAGITFSDERFAPVGERFFDAVSISDE